MTVSRSSIRSAEDVPLVEVVMPPPKRSDRPPPRLLWRRMKAVSVKLSTTSTMDSVVMGHVMSGISITR